MSHEIAHAVRDSYARDRLASVVAKVINTGCPTLWGLTPEHCATIPLQKSKNAVITLSAWRPDPDADRSMIELAVRNYRDVFFFSQMQDDYDYLQSLNFGNIKIIPPTLPSYDRFLESEVVDFIGTRLHGGIRCLQKGHRALIVAIDVRGTEIGKDTSLPVVQRGDIAGIQAWIDSAAPTEIHLPTEAISTWKSQFKAI